MNTAYAIRDRVSNKLAHPRIYSFTDNLTHARFYDNEKGAKKRIALENRYNPRGTYERVENEWVRKQITIDLEIIKIEVNIIEEK